MSLHAQLSPEAAQQLTARNRSTTISSFIIALLITALVGVILFIIGFALPEKELAQMSYISEKSVDEPTPDKPTVSTSIKKNPTPPSATASNRVITANAPSSVVIPEIMHVTDTSALGMSDNDDFGDSAGFNGTDGGQGILPPSISSTRCSKADRLARLEETGGTAACDDAVLNALRWLKEKQHNNGSWNNQNQVAMTGLALLAYLGHCETPESPEFGETVLNATIFLIDTGMKNNGKLASDFKAHWCYEHAIATYALCECHTFSKSFGYTVPHLEEATQDAVQWILNNPNPTGGWNYTYDEKARFDTSINAWHLQALKAAKTSGLEFKNLRRSINKALDAIIETQQKHGGFGYNKNGPVGSANGHFTLTGAGTLCVQQHKGISNRSARSGIQYLEKNSHFNFNEKANLYEHYYTSQAMVNYGGEPWKKYNLIVRDELLKQQKPNGSWPNPQGNAHQAGPIYNTCLATLMMEVYYRYLPGTASTVR